MISREEALAFIMKNENLAMRDFLFFTKEVLRKHPVIPPEARVKFITAGEGFGEFKLGTDWLNEAEQEVWDGVMYAGLHRLKTEMLDPPPFR